MLRADCRIYTFCLHALYNKLGCFNLCTLQSIRPCICTRTSSTVSKNSIGSQGISIESFNNKCMESLCEREAQNIADLYVRTKHTNVWVEQTSLLFGSKPTTITHMHKCTCSREYYVLFVIRYTCTHSIHWERRVSLQVRIDACGAYNVFDAFSRSGTYIYS